MAHLNILNSKNNKEPNFCNDDRADGEYIKGRGAQFNTTNRFEKVVHSKEHLEAVDDWVEPDVKTQYIETVSKSIVNKVDSPDVSMLYSMNPYQGCEHGCIYCFARNSFEYWGYSAGIDFESKIIVKKNAPQLLRKFLLHPKWECVPISISGNTDCYQPAEKRFRLTQNLLEVCNQFNQPVGIITKNAGILRDKILLEEMAKKNIVSVIVTITSLNEDLRRVMEPRTTTGLQRLKVIEQLSKAGVQVGVMMGPVIPGLNDAEMPAILKAAAGAGATFSGYTFIRLNGAVKLLFYDWLYKNFSDRADKVWHLIESAHNGKVNDSQWGRRMRGDGAIAKMVADQYKAYTKKYSLNDEKLNLDCTLFKVPGQQATLF